MGVHIRRSDHEAARLLSPDAAFAEAMERLCAGGFPGFSGFFLATDDEVVIILLFASLLI